MSDFARQQNDFQQAILSGDDAVLAELVDSPKQRRDVLFGVYRHAYGSRLIEALRNDHDLLHAYLGDEMFDTMGHAYVAANPSQHPNMRWFSRELPDFLRSAEPYGNYPILADIAALERAFNDAFDAEDTPVLGPAEMAGFAPDQWSDLRFAAHPSAQRLDVTTNASSVWLALRNDETPPDPAMLEERCHLLVWRQDLVPMFRELAADEAMMWDEAARGVPFGALCAMLATNDDPDGAAARAAGYLHGWVVAGLLRAASIGT